MEVEILQFLRTIVTTMLQVSIKQNGKMSLAVNFIQVTHIRYI